MHEDSYPPHPQLMRPGMWMKLGLAVVVLATALLGAPGDLAAQTDAEDEIILGFKVRFGGRYDDVRMCVASGAGVKGGIAADVSFFMDFGLRGNWTIHVDLPVFRPILFATSFHMLQFEPSVGAHYRLRTAGIVDVIVGPTLGFSLHHGPDYRSTRSGPGRGPSFFALGPTVGGYFGLDFKRPGRAFNFQLGLSPYVTPMFSVGDPEDHRGVVAGGLVDALFRWGAR
jgi:hypothetical protein